MTWLPIVLFIVGLLFGLSFLSWLNAQGALDPCRYGRHQWSAWRPSPGAKLVCGLQVRHCERCKLLEGRDL